MDNFNWLEQVENCKSKVYNIEDLIFIDVDDTKTCIKCKKAKNKTNFSKDKSRKDGFANKCKSCFKIYQQNNKEIFSKINKKWSKDNYEKINKNRNCRKANEPLFKLRCNISTLINNSIKRNNHRKISKTSDILCCSIDDFKKHIENKFTEGMNWENAGKWHLDHIYPVSLAKDEEELLKLNHYTNFQPLWAIDNIIKGNKII